MVVILHERDVGLSLFHSSSFFLGKKLSTGADAPLPLAAAGFIEAVWTFESSPAIHGRVGEG